MTIKEFLSATTKKFEQAGISSARLDAEVILAHTMGKDRVWLLARSNEKMSKSTQAAADKLIDKRLTRQPVSYVIGRKEFYGLDFYVDERVLTPRDETELIAEEVIKHAPQKAAVIDIGTGSGALAIAIAKHRPDLSVSASELSKPALEVAAINAEKILGTDHQIDLIRSDLFCDIVGQFDIIITNLPYVSSDYKPRMMAEVKHEPAVSLFGGPNDGLDLYRKFFKQAPAHLKPGGKVYLESDPWQHQELTKIAAQAGLKLAFQNYLILGFALKTS